MEPNYFDNLPKVVLYKTALLLPLEDINNLCWNNEKLNNLLCDNDNFWQQKLYHDYPETIGVFDKSYVGQFKTLYGRTYTALFRLKDFTEISTETKIDWKTAKYFIIDINYRYLIRSLEITLSLEFPDENMYSENPYNENIFYYFADTFRDLSDKILDKYSLLNRTNNGGKKCNKNIEEEFPHRIPSMEILKYIEPLLLKELENNNIRIVEKNYYANRVVYTPINYNSSLTVNFTEET